MTIKATNETIRAIVDDSIRIFGINADLNDIDVSEVTNMTHLFSARRTIKVGSRHVACIASKFNGDISQWDVSNVKNMSRMFLGSKFKGDISQWNVSNVEDMTSMFERSYFSYHFAQSKHFGKIHFLCKATDDSLELHPKAQAVWDEHAPLAQSMGLSGPELGRAVWTSYQASLTPQVATEALEGFDFSM